MEQKSMTALVSLFSRAYHSVNNETTIFNDSVARNLLTEEEYQQISGSMAAGIHFFNPSFQGTDQEALRWVVDQQLSPSPLGRAAYAERLLKQAVLCGTRQYLILGAGYDSFAYRKPEWAKDLVVFELDHPATAQDKQMRLVHAGIEIPEHVQFIQTDFLEKGWTDQLLKNAEFDSSKITFCTMLGLLYYLSKDTLDFMLGELNRCLPKGSTIVFDYPDEKSNTDQVGERAKKQAMIAKGAGETMLAQYSYDEMEHLLENHHFLIYEHLTPEQITEQYFAEYNLVNKAHPMTAFDNVNYCLAVSQG